MCIARVNASVDGNSIRNTFTDCIHAIYIVLVYVLAEIYLQIKLNFLLLYTNLGINTQCKQVPPSNVQYNIRLLPSNVQSALKHYNKIRNECFSN